jgi:hypothetical protein
MLKRILRALAPALVLATLPALSSAAVFVGVAVNVAPPPLPVYVQPPCPAPGYIWVPGYWAWNDGGYYWVPGTWLLPPEVGLLWTPGYWDWDGGIYHWHAGYWGPRVGFYGGVDYGFGYDGVGFAGGYWRGGIFFYNRAVWRVGPSFVTNVYYRRPEYVHREFEHVSYNGGPHGVRARPTRFDLMAERERRATFTYEQRRQERLAFADRSLRADVNHGRPPIAATERPAMFHGRGAVGARAAGGRVRLRRGYAPMRSAGTGRRSDRPPWATGQVRGSERMMQRGPARAGARFERPQQPFQRTPQRFQRAPQQFQRAPQRFQSPPQRRFQGASPQQQPRYRAPQRFESRPAPQYRFRAAPQGRPQYRGGVRRGGSGAAARRPVERGQPRGQPPRERPPQPRGGNGHEHR